MNKQWRIFLAALILFSCSKNQAPVTYYPPAGEIYAGEDGRLVMPDDERVPVLLGRSVRAFKDGWAAYVSGRTDLGTGLRKKGAIRWVPAHTEVRVIMIENRLGEPFLFVRIAADPTPAGGLLEHPSGWWTDARNFQITVVPAGSGTGRDVDNKKRGELP